MPMRLLSAFTLAILLVKPAYPQQTPSPEAAEWWRLTTALSNDSMEGRDTGTEAYERAAKLVAAEFEKSGLKSAGDNGSYFQRVPMRESRLDLAHSKVEIKYADSAKQALALKLLEEITIAPRYGQAAELQANMVFLGYGLPLPGPNEPFEQLKNLSGTVAIIFNNTPPGLSPQQAAEFIARRTRGLAEAHVSAILSIDNPAATEPAHWPLAYARTVTVQPSETLTVPEAQRLESEQTHMPLQMRISAEAAAKLFTDEPLHPFATILSTGEKGLQLPSFSLHAGLNVAMRSINKQISSPNILAILRGSDPALASEYVALSAHLDGYGFGTPVDGDSLYNGTLDDAAYVATLLELAHKLTAPGAAKPKRSLLFCIFTGEEKGLLGSQFFTQHPTVPAAQIVADLNLDQLRPIFPLKILTMEGIADSSLGEMARTVAQRFHIELRPDREPERNLFRRADNYNFVRIGVPIASFIFGYDPGTPEERIYRNWYARRYHKPQDDLATPIVWPAAVEFNDFYRALALAIANAPTRPHWLPASPYAPKP